MAKPKNPLLSLEAHGSIADSLTFQKRSRTSFARTKPVPTDPQSLAQIYQRWDYYDQAQLWHLLSAAQKEAYNTHPDRGKITGFNYWMKTRLNTLPDLAGRWHLDIISGAITPDSSKNDNDGTIIGASQATGLIDGALLFDGINDLVQVAHDPSLVLSTEATLEAFIYLTSRPVRNKEIIAKTSPPDPYEWTLRVTATHFLSVIFIGLVNAILTDATTPLQQDTWYHVTATWDGTNKRLFINGQQVAIGATTGSINPGTGPLFIGAYRAGVNHWPGVIDEARIYTRALSPTEILLHSERRYPT